MFFKVLLTILGILSIIDIIAFIKSAFGAGSGAFTGGLSRPFGVEVSMFCGFIIKLIETALFVIAIAIWV